MSTTFILAEVERVLARYLEGTDGVTVYHGIQHLVVNEEGLQVPRALPAVDCICQSSTFDAQASGSQIASAVVSVTANADDTTGAGFRALVKSVFDALVTDTIVGDLNTAAVSGAIDFTASGILWQSQRYEIRGRSWVAELELEIHCAGQQLG